MSTGHHVSINIYSVPYPLTPPYHPPRQIEELKVSVETHLKIRRSLETEVREAQSRISELQQQAHNFGGIKSNMAVELQGEVFLITIII